MAYDPDNILCKACNVIRKLFNKECESKKRYDQNKADYEKYKNDPNYKNVKFNSKTGGLMATHKGRKKHKNEKTLLEYSPTQLEDFCQNEIFKMGGSCIIQNENTQSPNGQYASSLDAIINGELMDIRSVCSKTTKIVNSLTDKQKQLISYNNDVGGNANALCLYYHVPEWFNEQNINDAIISYKKICNARGEDVIIKIIVIILRGGLNPIYINI
ncbi:MAG: hypothetical protein MJ211_00465 [Bacteroidales bacterium]|nr:hypothetical protein [Bacteroidales bacterium]